MATAYDCYDYLGFWRQREFEDQAERAALKRFFAQIPNRDSLVDIGGGYGRLASFYAPFFKHCLLLDPSWKNLAQAKEKLSRFPQLEVRKASLPRLGLKPATFDVALLIRVSHHFRDLKPVLAAVYSPLKPGGFLILELANKIHLLARLKAWRHGDFNFTRDLTSSDRRSSLSRHQRKITFVNHHPQLVNRQLRAAGFTILEALSVSNLRLPLVKKVVPSRLLLAGEKLLQKPLGRLQLGPSLFILAQRQ